jgi:O-acetyl-ADP-ribose deacetylase (regulator of RNase III)
MVYAKGGGMNVVKGDLLELGKLNKFDIIMHGCNCFNTMGGGIALQIANRFPDAKLADDETVRGDAGKLGTYTIGMDGRLVILNCYTQYSISRDGRDVFEYLAFERVLDRIALRFGKWRIGLPLIGMGLAGGDPERIVPMIERFAQNMERQGGSATLVEWEKK